MSEAQTIAGWTREQMADEAIELIPDGASLNLGIGMHLSVRPLA